ncbi:SDR family NAD(P)-dependent oxidoreductase, partial [Rhodoferax sp.]|uniref:SDR family NAD(P)-dependent oxidoreductase n=1 Tax=Rhodoferax sp. TaxID=50421 RepID=UPI00374DF270
MAGSTPYSASYPSLRGKNVFVTGGSSGIGADLVRGFARQGAQVAFNGLEAEAASALVQELNNLGYLLPLFSATDVTDVQALQDNIAAAQEQLGAFDVLINNVGNDRRQSFESVDVSFFDWMTAVNLRAHFFAIQSVLPGMKAKGAGSIVNIG